MGSVFSGRTGPRGGKTAVESLLKVQINQTRKAPGSPAAPRLVFDAADVAEVSYGPLRWHVHVDETEPHFGGRRRWFACLACSCRRTTLYVVGDALACRVCLGLRYASQHETERDRLFRRAHKLRDRLGWSGGVADERGGRPGGMHEMTYCRLSRNLASLTAKILSDLEDWVEGAERTF
ncbi:hypothetical protein [Ramlibacter sp.]|uniref:hypothetical protein n=1 Tax=Ramlibacter sp. TaxID=1917967 RepID=UPI002C95ADC4|nr:hypothetical protein [Ramlibacter sp.]HWI81386.1 hypothetical protein [Ramlibacter sp.]